MSSSAVPEVHEIEGMSAAEAESVARLLDQTRRRAEAAAASYVARVQASGTHLSDGHRTITAWGRAACNWSSAEAARLARLGRVFELLPHFATAAREGTIGVAQMHALAAVAANPRVRPHLAESEPLLVRAASELDHDDFITLLRRWEQAADVDGAERRHDRIHRERRAHLALTSDRMYLDAVGGLAHGVQLQEILDRFTQREWQHEWDEGVRRHGSLMSPALMVRSPQQRRFDAVVALFRAAAGSHQVGGEVVVNILIDQQSFEHQLARVAGGDPEPIDPATASQRRCETERGVVLHPDDVVAAALVGHVRRIVVDSKGVVLDFGRRQRLFTGALREAVLLTERHCVWAGCDRPAHQCEADHIVPYSRDGPTRAANGGVLCSHHNRWKNRGHFIARRNDGTWTTHRLDGTTVGWRSALAALVAAA